MLNKLVQLKGKAVNWFGWLGIVLFSSLAVVSCFFTKRMYTGTEVLYGEWDNPLIKIVFMGSILLIYVLLDKIVKRVTPKGMQVIAVLSACLVTVFCMLLTEDAESIPEADQWYVYVAADGLFHQEYTNLQEFIYYTVCPYQLGLAEVYAVVARIAGVLNYSVLRYAQAICVGVSVYFIYAIVGELFRNRKAQVLCLLFSVFFLPLSLYSQFLYGETIGVCMSLISIYFFLVVNRSGQKAWIRMLGWMIAILAFGFVYLVRPALTVIWVAMAIIQFCLCMREKKWWRMLVVVAMLLFGIGIQKVVVAYAGETAGVAVDNGMPVVPLTIAMGLQDNDPNHTGAGSYNAYNYNLFMETGYDKEMASYRAIRNIGSTLFDWLKNPGRMCRHIWDKILNQWTEPGYDAFTMTYRMEAPKDWVENLYYGRLHQFVYTILDCFQTLCYLMLSLWFGYLLKMGKEGIKTEKIQNYLIGLIMIGEFFFSLLWEASCRYVYPYMVIVIPCVAGCVAFYCDFFLKKCRAKLNV